MTVVHVSNDPVNNPVFGPLPVANVSGSAQVSQWVSVERVQSADTRCRSCLWTSHCRIQILFTVKLQRHRPRVTRCTPHVKCHAWHVQASNIIYVDQPINTGFSYSHDPRDMRHDEDGMAQASILRIPPRAQVAGI